MGDERRVWKEKVIRIDAPTIYEWTADFSNMSKEEK